MMSCADSGIRDNVIKNQTDKLTVGCTAPTFTLTAANREGEFSLAELISRSALVLEFTRGTW